MNKMMAGMVVVALAWGASAGTVASEESGDWGSTDTWGGTLPVAGDDVGVSHNVRLEADPEIGVGSLTVNAGATLTFDVWDAPLVVTGAALIEGTVTHTPQTATSAPWDPNSRVWIEAGSLTVAEGGAIDVSGKGYAGSDATVGYGPGGGVMVVNWGSGGSHGGMGGANSQGTYGVAEAPVDHGSAGGRNSWNWGDNPGGGAVFVDVAGKVTVEGALRADAPDGWERRGGGSGGSVYILCNAITGGGTVSANGGNSFSRPQDGHGVGGGGGGRVAIHYDAEAQELESPSLAVMARGGRDTLTFNYWGMPGSVWLTDAQLLWQDRLYGGNYIVDGGDLPSFSVAGDFTFSDGAVALPDGFALSVGGNLVIADNGGFMGSNVAINVTGDFDFSAASDFAAQGDLFWGEGSSLAVGGNFTVSNTRLKIYGNGDACPMVTVGGNVTFAGSAPLFLQTGFVEDAMLEYGASLAAGGDVHFVAGTSTFKADPTSGSSVLVTGRDITIESGAALTGAGQGFPRPFVVYERGNGPGGGLGASDAGGGGHGGEGFPANETDGITYDDAEKPMMAGSSGGETQWIQNTTADGGGAISLVALRYLTHNGLVNMDALAMWVHPQGGGSAGGSIFAQAKIFRGAGTFTAFGGDGGTSTGGGGGGGRIAVWANDFAGWNGVPAKVSEGLELDAGVLAQAVAGGAGGKGNGEAGTVFWKSLPPEDPVIYMIEAQVPFTAFGVPIAGLLSTTGTSVTAVYCLTRENDDGGEELSNWTQTLAAGVTKEGVFTNLTALALDKVWCARFYAENATGDSITDPIFFTTADVYVQKVSDADEFGEVAGAFRITRASGSAAMAVDVPFTLGGTAVEGTDYESVTPSVTFGIGETEKYVVITPIFTGEQKGGMTVTLTLDDGRFIGSGRNASMAMAYAPIVTGNNETTQGGFWHEGVNWTLGREPIAGDTVTVSHNMTIDRRTLGASAMTIAAGATVTFTGWESVLKAGAITLNGTLTHTAQSVTNAPWTPDARVWVVCTTLDIMAGAAINASAKGYTSPNPYAAGYGPGGGVRVSNCGYGGSYGGVGGMMDASNVYGEADDPADPGSAGGGTNWGRGGYGGGVIRLDVSGNVRIDGRLSADGETGLHANAGGGSGGAILVQCATVTGGGALSANGGWVEGDIRNGVNGAGGGGRIALLYNASAQASVNATARPALTFAAHEGRVGTLYAGFGDPGTIVLTDASFFPIYASVLYGGTILIPGFTAWTTPGNLELRDGLQAFAPGFALTVNGNVNAIGNGGLLIDGYAATVTGHYIAVNETAETYYNAIRSTEGSGLAINGNLTVENAQLGVEPGQGVPTQVSVGGNATFSEPNALSVNAPAGNSALDNASFRLSVGGTLSFANTVVNIITREGGMVAFEAKTVTIADDVIIDGNVKGYASTTLANVNGAGPGGGKGGDPAGGGGHGGAGGNASELEGLGLAYGDGTFPTDSGSAGGSTSWASSNGRNDGGAGISFTVAKAMTLDGAITMNGGSDIDGRAGGGAGGGIRILCQTFAGTGSLSAFGGNVATSNNGTGGTGGGGRIAVHAQRFNQWLGTPLKTVDGFEVDATSLLVVAAGTCGEETPAPGECGTLYWRTIAPAGTLLIVR
ncbi:MAG: hypothetical protein FWF84_02100 [Kiritimatiellaeota bacterium]|nr:hypothetical protein [Kiritimatiellota bacterium]